MAAYIPPKKGLSTGPQIGAPVIGDRRGGAAPAGAASDEAVIRGAADLEAWRGAQRQNVANSIIGRHTATFEHPDFFAHYSNVDGAETLTVHPKPASQPAVSSQEPTQADEQPIVPYERPNLPDNPDAPTLYLMVLFKKNGIAAVRMSALPDVVVDFVGTSAGSTWSTNPTQQHQVMQQKIGDTEWLMLPLDFVKGSASTTHFLYAGSFTIGTATDASIASPPLLNGDSSTCYTLGGSYQLGALGLRQEDKATAGDTPCAIAPDGTCYFDPHAGADCQAYTDAPASATLGDAVQKQLRDQSTSSTEYYGCTIAGRRHTGTKYEHTQHGSTTVETTFSQYTIDIFQAGPSYVGTSVAGYGYSGVATFGAPPQVAELNVAEAGAGVISFTGSGFEIVGGGGSGGNCGVNIPLMSVNSSKKLEIQYVAANATASNNIGPELTGPESTPNSFSGISPTDIIPYTTDVMENGYTYTDCNDSLFYTKEAGSPPLPSPKGETENDVVAYYNACIGAMSASPGLHYVERHTASRIAVVVSNDGTTTEGGGPGFPGVENNPAYDSITTSDNSGTQTVCTLIGFPTMRAAVYSGSASSTLSVLGASFETSRDSGGHVTGSSGTVILHCFPPMYGTKPYYDIDSIEGDQIVTTVVTPYDTYKLSQFQTGFRGWLNLSNGKQVIQGYSIGSDKLFMFLDGSDGVNIMDALSKALDCDANTVHAAVMDVTLQTIKGLSGIKPPDYSGA